MISGKNSYRKTAMEKLLDESGGETMRNTAATEHIPSRYGHRKHGVSSGISQRSGNSHSSARVLGLVRDTEAVIRSDDNSGFGNKGGSCKKNVSSKYAGSSIGNLGTTGIIAGAKALSSSAPVKPIEKKTGSKTVISRPHSSNYSKITDNPRNMGSIPAAVSALHSGSGKHAQNMNTAKPAIPKKTGIFKPEKPKEKVIPSNPVVAKADEALDMTKTVCLAPEPAAPTKSVGVKSDMSTGAAAGAVISAEASKQKGVLAASAPVTTEPIKPPAAASGAVISAEAAKQKGFLAAMVPAATEPEKTAAAAAGAVVSAKAAKPKGSLAAAAPVTTEQEKPAGAAGNTAVSADSGKPKEKVIPSNPVVVKADEALDMTKTVCLAPESAAPKESLGGKNDMPTAAASGSAEAEKQEVLAAAAPVTTEQEKPPAAAGAAVVSAKIGKPKGSLAAAVPVTNEPEKSAEAAGGTALPTESAKPEEALAAAPVTNEPEKPAEAAGGTALPTESAKPEEAFAAAVPVTNEPEKVPAAVSGAVLSAEAIKPDESFAAISSTVVSAEAEKPEETLAASASVTNKPEKPKETVVFANSVIPKTERSLDTTNTVSFAPEPAANAKEKIPFKDMVKLTAAPLKESDNTKNMYDLLRNKYVYLEDVAVARETVRLPFKEKYKQVRGILPLQVRNEKVNYPVSCQYFAVISSFVMNGYKYKEGITVDDVEKIGTYACVAEKGYEYAIKKIFGLSVVRHEIPDDIKYEDFKNLVKDNPAMIRFKQDDYWKNGVKDGHHGIGYGNGGFFEAWRGYNGETWEAVRMGRKENNTALFSSNDGGWYFEVQH